MPAAKKESSKVTKKPEAKPQAKVEKKAAKPAPKKEEKKPAKPAAKSSSKTYMLTYRAEQRKWAIKIKGGEKVIKYFNTKAEAEEYLEELADNQGASVSIKKKDGKFQKKH